MTRSVAEIITLLGGWEPVADEIGCTQSAISNWKIRGIPPARWLTLVRFAASRKPKVIPPLTIEEIEAANGLVERRVDATEAA